MEKEEFCVSVEEETSQIIMEKPHVVILGAGASRAAALDGDVDGRIVPLMNDLIEIVELDKILIKWDISFEEKNFESIYSRIHEDVSKRNFLDTAKSLLLWHTIIIERRWKSIAISCSHIINKQIRAHICHQRHCLLHWIHLLGYRHQQ